MRPPRPWPSWRRARARSIAARSSSSPAGMPSTMVVSPGPWDSPGVTMRSGTGGTLDPRRARAFAPTELHPGLQHGHDLRDLLTGARDRGLPLARLELGDRAGAAVVGPAQ